MKNIDRVEFLTKQYSTGPVVNTSPDQKTPYLAYLNKNLADGITQFNTTVTNAQEAGADWVC
jgi:hypothetical protein